MNSSSQTTEYSIKAAFIKKFTLFVDWPAESVNQNFIITMLGTNPFGGSLDLSYTDDLINNREVIIEKVNSVTNLGDTDILFLPYTERRYLKDVVQKYKNNPVLIISDTPGHAKNGAHISFYLRSDGRVHFEVNRDKLIESGLNIDLRLLKYAKVVESKR